MECLKLCCLLFLSWIFFTQSTHQLQNSQIQVLLQLRMHLEFPSALDTWENYNGDLCNISPTAHMSISCQDNSVTELKIMGTKLYKVPKFHGFAIHNQTLSESFSIDSLVTTLTRLSSLRVLSLVSLGIWGQLPGKIHRLAFLEYLDLNSNYIFGSIPPEISRLVRLQTLILDGNNFNGSISDNLDSLSNLTVLSLKSNRLNGRFPSSISRISSLTDLALSHNEISGELPDLRNLASLHMLDLRDNRLVSKLPTMPKGLFTVLLSKNSFSGEIPPNFWKLVQLQHVDLSFNHLIGTLSSSLFSLPNISYLNLASNKLSGALPENLSCGSRLGFVDLSNNKLVGKLPSCLGSVSGERLVKVGGNCLSINGNGDQHPKIFCREANVERKQTTRKTIGMFIAVIGGVLLVLVLLAMLFLMLYRNCCSRDTPEQQTRPKASLGNLTTGVSSEILASARLISQATKLGSQGAPACRTFSIEELKEATNNFDSSSFMGEGSVGKLYKGTQENGTRIAVRSLALSKKLSIQNLKARIDWFSKLHHPNLVSFMGHCIESSGQDDYTPNKLFLVYEYVPNGNYRTHLSESSPEKVLTWPERLAILIDVAKAVHFLHTGVIPGSFNNWLRSNNILLDEHRIAKLSDYGLSIIAEENKKLEAKRETQKQRNALKVEDDVYHFGFILLESLVGPIVSGKGEAFLLNEMTSFGSQDGRRRIVDPVVLTTSSQESLSIIVAITKKCVCSDMSSRPSFEDVLWNLQYAAQVQASVEIDQKSDSTS